MNIFSRLKAGLQKTRQQIAAVLGSRSEINDSFYESLEDALISADIGMDFSLDIITRLKEIIKRSATTDSHNAYLLLKQLIAADLDLPNRALRFDVKPAIVLVAGVNGTGKTTTIGKLAHYCVGQGKSVMLGAIDTFRAGAIEQLAVWARRTGAELISQQPGSDPASVAFDAVTAAQARGVDVLFLDTAGLLHNKVNLMHELEKIVRVIKRIAPDAPHEMLLVIDATTGQNALNQVRIFHECLGLTGLIITKLDGTAKGGIVCSLTRALGIPIKKIGVGEGLDDLQDFDAAQFVEAMFGDLK